jgi:hypothetical protein
MEVRSSWTTAVEGCINIFDSNAAVGDSCPDGFDCSVMAGDFCINNTNVKVRLPARLAAKGTDGLTFTASIASAPQNHRSK